MKCAPQDIALRDPVASGAHFLPGGLGSYSNFWDIAVLQSQPLWDRLLAWLRLGVTLDEFLLDDFKGSGIDSPFAPCISQGNSPCLNF